MNAGLLSRLVSPFLVILFTLVSFFILVRVFGPIPFDVTSITTSKTDLFTVDGTGRATAIPDTAQINLGVTKSAPSIETAKNQVNDVMNRLTTDLKNLGVKEKDIQTTNYSVSPNYDYTGGSQRTNGYTVTADVTVKMTPPDKANQAIDVATKDGANTTGGVTFTLNDSAQKTLEEKARKEAIQNAKDKAQSIADTAGIRLARLVNVQENTNVPQPVMYSAQKAQPLSGGGEPTQLSPGQNSVSITVTLSYETY